MPLADKLENACKLLLGATLAFYFCHFLWDVEPAQHAAQICTLGWVVAHFWFRRLGTSAAAA